MKTLEKIWRGFVKSLVYILTPLVVLYGISLFIDYGYVNWGWTSLPENLVKAAHVITEIGTIPAVFYLVAMVAGLAKVAFGTTNEQKKQKLKTDLLEQKLDTIEKNNIVVMKCLKVLVNNNVLVDESEAEKLTSEINTRIAVTEKQQSNNIDFDTLNIEEIKSQLATMKEIGKALGNFISNK